MLFNALQKERGGEVGSSFPPSYLLVVEFIVVSLLGGARCLSNVNTPPIGSSWLPAMQLDYPDILLAFSAARYPPALF